MEECIRTNISGFQYHELTCLYPFLQPFYASFETSYDPIPVWRFMRNNPWIPIVICSFYGIGIMVGQTYFKGRKPWNWRTSWAVWNLILSIFSTLGFLRILPQLIHNITLLIYSTTSSSWEEMICMDPETNWGSGSTGLWAQAFVLSKIPELFDTFFIIVHKKKLIFLHWYHHITVLLVCWHGCVTKAPGGIFFAFMNYGVHSIMYFYYFLMAITKITIISNKTTTTTKTSSSIMIINNPRSWAILITGLQISQMIVGVLITCLLSFVSSIRNDCTLGEENIRVSFLMYASYLFLFVQFFVRRYCFGNEKTKKKVCLS